MSRMTQCASTNVVSVSHPQPSRCRRATVYCGCQPGPTVVPSLSSVHDGHSVSPCCVADVVLCRVRVRCRHNCACTPT